MTISGYKKNKLQQIRGFCTVIEEGSILQASKKMNTAQSNVSLQISSLEKTLGISLFKRENQRLSPTVEALRFYKICKKALNEVDFLFEYASKAIKEDYDNVIKLAGHSYMLSHILPPFFKKTIDSNPNVKFELYNSSYEEATDMLNNGIIDFAVLPANKKVLPKNIVATKFYKCEFGLAVSKDNPLAKVPDSKITWNMIAKHDFISLGKGVTAQGFKAVVQDNLIQSRFTLHNCNWEICTGIVQEGVGITGTDLKYLTPFNKYSNVIIKKVPNLLPEYQFYILINEKAGQSISALEFIKLLTQEES